MLPPLHPSTALSSEYSDSVFVVDSIFKKHIRSFVIREGRLTPGQERALTELWPQYGLEPDSSLDLEQAFERNAPRVLEIGFGNGASLAEMAANNPGHDFLGIEVHRPGVGHLLQLLSKQEISNVRVLCTDAVEVLEQNIPDNSFSQISIFFPDPWPKKRHHKRRLIQTAFVNLLSRKLRDNGVLHAATDWENYADHIKEVLAPIDCFSEAPLNEALPRPDTKYEQRGLRKGHRVNDLVYRLNKT